MITDGLRAIEHSISRRSDDRKYYVYIWFYEIDGCDIPFYVGKGCGNRYKNKSSRSKTFLDFVNSHKCTPVIAAYNLTDEEALWAEEQIKARFKDVPLWIMDAENDKTERKHRQRTGIDRAKEKGVRLGRPRKEPEEFQKIAQKQKEGLLTVADACKELGISRATYYKRLKEVS